jgi:RND family efflux transporter MFP subunit
MVKPVKLYKVPTSHADDFDAFLAQVDAGERSQLSFQVPGVVHTLMVEEGQHVSKGEVLAALDDTDYRLALEAHQAEYDLARISFERDRKLAEKKLISTDRFDQSDVTYKAAEAALKQARTKLSYTTLKAPFDGVVSLSFVKRGQYIESGVPAMNILAINNLDVDFSLPVAYVKDTGIESLKRQSFSVVLDHHPERALPARFKAISTSPDGDTNSYSATVSVTRPENTSILPGMTGQVQIMSTSAANSLFLPEAALFNKLNGKKAVWRYSPETQAVHSVEIELTSSGAVAGGITKGDLIVVAGTANLIEGQKVKAWKREGGI